MDVKLLRSRYFHDIMDENITVLENITVFLKY